MLPADGTFWQICIAFVKCHTLDRWCWTMSNSAGMIHRSQSKGYRQMFCAGSYSHNLLTHVITTHQSPWLRLPAWISDGLTCRGTSCLPVVSTETEGMDIALSLRPHFASTLLHTTPAVKQADCTGSPALQPDLALFLPNEDLGAFTDGSWSLAEARR